jgi:hypothetical protein
MCIDDIRDAIGFVTDDNKVDADGMRLEEGRHRLDTTATTVMVLIVVCGLVYF